MITRLLSKLEKEAAKLLWTEIEEEAMSEDCENLIGTFDKYFNIERIKLDKEVEIPLGMNIQGKCL